MYRRFNYTKRKEIQRRHCQVDLHRVGDGRTCFAARLNLAEYEFDPTSNIRIDAWRSNAAQRWDFGTVGEIAPPSQADRILRDVPVTAQFKVSVVASDGSGLLYGVSPALKPKREEEPKESLLPIDPDDTLGSEVWRLDFGGGHETAVLKLNSKIEGVDKMAAGDQIFRPLVLPEVFRGVLNHALLIEKIDLDDDRESAWNDWIKLAAHHLGGGQPPYMGPGLDESQRASTAGWIDQAVAAFAAKHEFMTPETFAETLAGRS